MPVFELMKALYPWAVRKKYLVALVVTIIFGAYWVNQQPNFECKATQDVVEYGLKDADALSTLSSNLSGSDIYGDYSSNLDKYMKKTSDLLLLSEAYRLRASKSIIENQNCFNEKEIREAKRVLDFQKYLAELK